MIKKIFVIIYAVILFACGCAEQKIDRDAALVEGVKLSDLRSAFSHQNRKVATVPFAEFTFFEFEMAHDKFEELQEAVSDLSQKEIHLHSEEAFSAEGFTAGFGTGAGLDEIAKKLAEIEARKLRESIILFFDMNTEEVGVYNIRSERSVFYTDQYGQTASMTLRAGELAIQIECKKNAVRGLCDVSLRPVFKPLVTIAPLPNIPSSIGKTVVFESAELSYQASASDFVILAPNTPQPEDRSLVNMMFCGMTRKESFRVFIIVCGRIRD